jgi:hypothetical protein
LFSLSKKRAKMRISILILCLLLSSCAPNSYEDFRKEGEARCRRLVHLLEKIECREDLIKAEADLKKEFTKVVEIIIEARTYQQDHPDKEMIILEENPLNEALKEQMMRIYHIEGGREILERAQRESLLRLDSFEKKIIPKKNQLKK